MCPGKRVYQQLYLASNSPRRKELLSLLGWEYSLLPAKVDETPQPNEDGMEYVLRIAKSKVLAATHKTDINGVIIAADTTVIRRGMNGKTEIYGKPRDQSEATEMLRKLRGRTHQVLTALSILRTQDGKIKFDYCTTDVPMRNYSYEEINAYVASGDPMDKAGAYAIQHAGFHPVEKLQGCYANVMGLPLCHLTRRLTQFGLHPKTDVPQTCQAAIGYNCSVYSKILIEQTQDNPLS